MRFPIISFTTDFGLRDPYVAEMKAVIMRISPGAEIIDISHEIDKYDVTMAAFTLACAAPFFPRGTIHVAVVDPSVGTRRRPIIIQTSNGYYVGPDNGILTLATRNDGGARNVHHIANSRFMLTKVSNTFHGRDIFAPAAAHLANGTPLTEFGPKIGEICDLTLALVTKKPGALVCEVIHIDDFGNIITNLQSKDIKITRQKPAINIEVKGTHLSLKLCETYTEVPPHKPLALFGSHSFLEISMNQDSAARTYKVKTGDRIGIQLDKKNNRLVKGEKKRV